MCRRTHALRSVLANARRTMEEFELARIASARMSLLMRRGEFVPMLRARARGGSAVANPTVAVAL
jgi:hypothetical protein